MDEREEILADMRERAKFYSLLTELGLPPVTTPVNVPVPVPVRSGTAPSLQDIRADLGDCQRCKLAPTRRNIVFGQGNPQARLMFVGEAPGGDEDEQGLAFVGKAGQLLTKIIEAIGLTRDEVFIANVLKCLRYNTTVQLENGTWERIGRLVARRYEGRVMSVDSEGRLVPKRVTGWYRSPLAGRPVYRLSYASSAVRGGNRAVTWLTGDHEVLTQRGWVHAACLTEGDRVALGQGLSDVAREVVVGSILGDGTINRSSAHLAVIHARRQEAYLRLKARALSELRPIVTCGGSSARRGESPHPTVGCRTRASRALRVLRSQFYTPAGKVVPGDLTITPRVLAIWFLDDGHTKVKSEHSALAEIAAHSFRPDGIEELLYRLSRDLAVDGYVRSSAPGRIQFDVEATLRVSELIAPFTPPSMRFKLHPRLRERIPFDEALYEPGAPRTVFDDALAEEVHLPGRNPTFFCIDVEDTHNFVTSGGVVHNCRPPNNRNPEPDEIESCQPFLERQIETIRPKVIVGLGKFGGQWLLKTMEPISRIRGRVGDYKGIKVVPTYHPAYLLRNPGAKRDVWEDMKLVRSLL